MENDENGSQGSSSKPQDERSPPRYIDEVLDHWVPYPPDVSFIFRYLCDKERELSEAALCGDIDNVERIANTGDDNLGLKLEVVVDRFNLTD